jgi:hypothetical protein
MPILNVYHLSLWHLTLNIMLVSHDLANIAICSNLSHLKPGNFVSVTCEALYVGSICMTQSPMGHRVSETTTLQLVKQNREQASVLPSLQIMSRSIIFG